MINVFLIEIGENSVRTIWWPTMIDGDRRDFERLPIVLAGTVTFGEGVGIACVTSDISLGGARITTSFKGRIGARAKLTLPNIGCLESRITRVFGDGFAVEFDKRMSIKEVCALNGMLLKYLSYKPASRLTA